MGRGGGGDHFLFSLLLLSLSLSHATLFAPLFLLLFASCFFFSLFFIFFCAPSLFFFFCTLLSPPPHRPPRARTIATEAVDIFYIYLFYFILFLFYYFSLSYCPFRPGTLPSPSPSPPPWTEKHCHSHFLSIPPPLPSPVFLILPCTLFTHTGKCANAPLPQRQHSLSTTISLHPFPPPRQNEGKNLKKMQNSKKTENKTNTQHAKRPFEKKNGGEGRKQVGKKGLVWGWLAPFCSYHRHHSALSLSLPFLPLALTTCIRISPPLSFCHSVAR